MKLRYRTIAMLAALGALTAGCQHHPVYPSYGELLITSSPSGAEIFLDGVSTKRSTPVRLVGVDQGSHQLALRYQGYKVARTTATVQGGMTKRVVVKLAMIMPGLVGGASTDILPRHMAYEQVQQRLYIANYTRFIDVFQVTGGAVSLVSKIEVPSPGTTGSKLVAVSRQAGKIYTTLRRDSVIVIDLATLAVTKRFTLQPDSTNCVQMRFTADGRTVYLADSLRHRIWVIDAASDAVTGYLSLSGAPSDFLVNPQNGHLYVTLSNTKQVIEMDGSGSVLHTSATGNRPGAMFHDDRWQRLGFCNITDKLVTVIDPAVWSLANGNVVQQTDPLMAGGAFGHDGTYIWTMTASLPYLVGDALACRPGTLHLLYLPTMSYVTHFPLAAQPVAMETTPDGLYLIVLHRFAHQLLVYRTETE